MKNEAELLEVVKAAREAQRKAEHHAFAAAAIEPSEMSLVLLGQAHLEISDSLKAALANLDRLNP